MTDQYPRKDDLRNSISMVLQDTHLFTDTVIEYPLRQSRQR